MSLFNHDNLHSTVKLIKDNLKEHANGKSADVQKAYMKLYRVLNKKEHLLLEEQKEILKIKEEYDFTAKLFSFAHSKMANLSNDIFNDDDFNYYDEKKLDMWYDEILKDFHALEEHLHKIRHLEHHIEKDEHKAQK